MFGQNATTCEPIVILPASDDELVSSELLRLKKEKKEKKPKWSTSIDSSGVRAAASDWLNGPFGAEEGACDTFTMAAGTNEL